jgi:hypothetical protein
MLLPIPVHGWIFPPILNSVLSDGADLDADTAGGDSLPVQLCTVGGTGLFVRKGGGIFPLFQGAGRAEFHAPHASGTHIHLQEGIGRKHRFGEYRSEPDSGTVLWGEEHVIYTEGPQPCQVRGMPVGEEGYGILLEGLDPSISIAGD